MLVTKRSSSPSSRSAPDRVGGAGDRLTLDVEHAVEVEQQRSQSLQGHGPQAAAPSPLSPSIHPYPLSIVTFSVRTVCVGRPLGVPEAGDPLHHVEAPAHPAEQRVDRRQPGVGADDDEELAAGAPRRLRRRLRHRHHAARVGEVRRWALVDAVAGPSGAGAGRVAALDRRRARSAGTRDRRRAPAGEVGEGVRRHAAPGRCRGRSRMLPQLVLTTAVSFSPRPTVCGGGSRLTLCGSGSGGRSAAARARSCGADRSRSRRGGDRRRQDRAPPRREDRCHPPVPQGGQA